MDIRTHILPFTAALAIFVVVFLLLDAVVMNMQGLSLLFHP